jgi:asparagine synthase (glutamine-hydrolysing)
VLADVARRTRQSVWSVLRQVWDAERHPQRLQDNRSTIISRGLRQAVTGVEHAWVATARSRGVPPGKLFHIRAIANLHANHGRSRRRREADLLYPLMSQPVLETCLGIATPDLAGGSYDRPFARSVFADRIPEIVLNRRTKGNLEVYFSRLVATSLPTLRPLLLDGCLCQAGLLDRQSLERVLDPNQLIWEARATDVLWAATVEAWVRYWQTRTPDSNSSPRAQALG